MLQQLNKIDVKVGREGKGRGGGEKCISVQRNYFIKKKKEKKKESN